MVNPSRIGSNSNDTDHPGRDGGSSVTEHNPGDSTDWTPDEQFILEDGLSQYASESNIIRYAKIAVQLQNKTVRDVAMRCRWMFKRDISKRRKEDYHLTRKSKDRKERMNEHLASTSYLATQTRPSLYSQGVVANGKSNAIKHSGFLPFLLQFILSNTRYFLSVQLDSLLRKVHMLWNDSLLILKLIRYTKISISCAKSGETSMIS